MQLMREKAVASRNVGSAAAWTLPQEVFTMETKRFLIPAVAALGLFFLGLPGLALSSANAAGLSPASAGHDQAVMSGKGDVTQVRWHGGGWRGAGWHGGWGWRGGGWGWRRAGWYGGGWGWRRPGWGWRRAGWYGGGWGWRRPGWGWRRAGWYGGGWGWPVGAGLLGVGYGLGYPGWGYGWGYGYPRYGYGGCGCGW
jgi:hypothetical protein